MSLSPGTRLGAYQIEHALGAGGMGEVYRARDTMLGRAVAIKVLPLAFGGDVKRLARFEREAKTLAALNHPNIAQIYGVEESNGTTALVMELVDGESLYQMIARGPIPVDEALGIAKQIAKALEAAHEKGIIHRDLKPANIALTKDGHVKVLDFGLAKAIDDTTNSFDAMSSPTLTSPAMMTGAGVILGTAAYMSPEQARGKTVDRRTDVWAYGCVLYEMLTGKRAFGSDTVSDTVAPVLKGDPDWSALPPIPSHVRVLLEGCLQKDSERITHLSTVRFLLNEPRVQDDGGIAPVQAKRTGRTNAVLVTIVAAVAATLGGALVSLTKSPSAPSRSIVRFSIMLDGDQQLGAVGRQTIAVSPDGSALAYVANERIFLRSLSDEKAHAISGIEGSISSPVFSPDGQSIAFWSALPNPTLKRASIRGGSVMTICPATNPIGMTWSNDSIVFAQPGGVMRVAAEGGTPELVASVEKEQVPYGPQILPAGAGTLFSIASGDRTIPSFWDDAQIVVQPPHASGPIVLMKGGSDARYLPTGHLVYAREGTLFGATFNLHSLKVTSKFVPVLEGVARSTRTAAAQFATSATGVLVYLPGPPRRSGTPRFYLAVVDEKGRVERLPLPAGAYESPRVSPDGKHIAFSTADDNDANVWVFDLSGTTAMRQLTFGGKNRFPVWSPDGQYVAFQSDRDGDHAIFRQRVDISGPMAERLTTPDSGVAHIPESWSRNDMLSFSVDEASRFSLWVLSVRDRRSIALPAGTATMLFASDFSPDGESIAYSLSQKTEGLVDPTVFVQPFPPTGATYMIGERTKGFHPVWSRDGRALSYSTGLGAGPQWVVVPLTMRPTVGAGNPTKVPNGGLEDSVVERSRTLSVRNYAFTTDGRRVGLLRDEAVYPSGPIRIVLNWFAELQERIPTR